MFSIFSRNIITHEKFGEFAEISAYDDLMCLVAKGLGSKHIKRFMNSAKKIRKMKSNIIVQSLLYPQNKNKKIYNIWLNNTVVSTERQSTMKIKCYI